MPVEELKKQYPELSAYNLVEPDILDDGETLSSISDDSVDFVIANHMIEHCQKSLVENFLRVLKRMEFCIWLYLTKMYLWLGATCNFFGASD